MTTLQLAVILVAIVVGLMLFPVILLAVERIRRDR